LPEWKIQARQLTLGSGETPQRYQTHSTIHLPAGISPLRCTRKVSGGYAESRPFGS